MNNIQTENMNSTKLSGVAHKRKILIIEDDELNLEMLSSLLNDQFEIMTADNGKTGLKELEEHYREISLVLLDVEMPVLDGIEVLKKVRDDELLSSVPIIIQTVKGGVDIELKCLELGAVDYITKPYNAEIIKKRIQNVLRLKESSITLEAVEHDAATGLYTEQAFMHYGDQMLRFKSDKKMHLIMAKVKDFKLIKNIYGARKADELLSYLASAYTTSLRNGLIGRRGKSSFVCLFYVTRDLDHQQVSEILETIAKNAPIPGIHIKYGLYEDVDKSLPISTICDYASIAAETVIDDYDCDLAYFTDEMAEKRIRNQVIESSFEDAIQNNEFVVYYQPKVDIHTEKVIGAEALVRWRKPDGSLVSPGEFIPVYERDGLIERLDEFVFRKVCRLQSKKAAEGKRLMPISVNLSRSSILHDGIVDIYIDIVKENDIPYASVPLELTESAAIYGERISKTTAQLVNAGFKLHIDDFGSGYSSLISINQLPFSTLKIDKSLIDHVCEDKGKTLVEQVIILSKLLNMKVIAEGVETKEQLEELKNMKCDEVQGFYYARPMPEKEFMEYISSI